MGQPDGLPVPVLAQWASPRARVWFSTPITAGVLDVTNWFVRVGNRSQSLFTATAIAPNYVELLSIGSGPDIGPDVVSYSPPPFDVVGPGGPAAAFADFPIT